MRIKVTGRDVSFFDTYYHERKFAAAYELGNIKAFSKKKNLSDFGVSFALQSFVYID
jgi:hypothetical protein